MQITCLIERESPSTVISISLSEIVFAVCSEGPTSSRNSIRDTAKHSFSRFEPEEVTQYSFFVKVQDSSPFHSGTEGLLNMKS